MLTFYLPIKAVHVAAVLVSGGLFALRGGFALAGARWPQAAPVRWLAIAIDTTLLTAALMLLTALRLNPLVVPWLATKLVLIVAYITLGAATLRLARTPRAQAACYAAALACFAFVVFVARAHHPLGLLREFAA